MPSTRRRTRLSLIIAVLAFLVACAVLVAISRHDASVRANSTFRELQPVTMSFSRLRLSRDHIVSIYWRMHFTGSYPHMPGDVALWHLRPFRYVDLTK